MFVSPVTLKDWEKRLSVGEGTLPHTAATMTPHTPMLSAVHPAHEDSADTLVIKETGIRLFDES